MLPDGGNFMEDVKRALLLDADATADDVIAAFIRMVRAEEAAPVDQAAQEKIGAITDPRMRLAELAERRAREKGIGLNQALEEVKRSEPEVVEDVSLGYGWAKKRVAART